MELGTFHAGILEIGKRLGIETQPAVRFKIFSPAEVGALLLSDTSGPGSEGAELQTLRSSLEHNLCAHAAVRPRPLRDVDRQ